MTEDGQKKYGVGAYVPENRGDIAGAARDNTSVSGNAAENSTNASGNGPVGAGEGSEGASGAKVGYEEGSNEKAQDAVLNGPRMENDQKKAKNSPRKIFVGMMIVLVVVAVAAIGVTALTIWGATELGGNVVDQVTDKDEPGDNQDESDEIVELSLDNQVVRGLYEWFNVKKFEGDVMTPFEPLGKFYPDDVLLAADVTMPQRVVIALQNLYDYSDGAEECKGDYDFLHWYDQNGMEHGSVGMKACFAGDVVREKIKEIFGGEAADFNEMNGDDATVIVGGDGWSYGADEDEFVNVASGATIQPIDRVLLRAEKDKERIYLYDAAGYVGCWMAGQIVCPARKLDGAEIADSEGITVENMKDFDDLFDNFKWTFVKNAEGNYVFEKLEKVN